MAVKIVKGEGASLHVMPAEIDFKEFEAEVFKCVCCNDISMRFSHLSEDSAESDFIFQFSFEPHKMKALRALIDEELSKVKESN